MKRNFTACLILAAAMILVPLITMQQSETAAPADKTEAEGYDGYISVMKSEDGAVEELPERDYLIGVLAAEADLTYHDEALKAQAVASYTYALYIKNYSDSDALEGADISDNPDTHQGYLSEAERKEKWGDSFDKYEKKAGEVVDSVLGEVIYYKGKPAMTVYHNLNNGKTQSSVTVWGKEAEYLSEVESPGDKLSTDYSVTVAFTYDDFEKRIETIDGVKLEKSKQNRIGEVKKNGSGYVESVEVCGNRISSADFRTVLDLKSCCFSIDTSEEKIKITTYGNGHMVGMSQYGADYMARQGADYREILLHYYRKTEIR